MSLGEGADHQRWDRGTEAPGVLGGGTGVLLSWWQEEAKNWGGVNNDRGTERAVGESCEYWQEQLSSGKSCPPPCVSDRITTGTTEQLNWKRTRNSSHVYEIHICSNW